MNDPKALVRRLVEGAINGNDLDVLDAVCTPGLAAKLRTAFSEFLVAFADCQQQIRELVADDRTVVARFRCTGSHHGEGRGLAPTGRRMSIDEVYFFRIGDGRIAGVWGLEDTWTRMQQLAGQDATLGELGSLG